MIFLYSFGDTFLFIQPHSQADDPPPRTKKRRGLACHGALERVRNDWQKEHKKRNICCLQLLLVVVAVYRYAIVDILVVVGCSCL